MRHDLEFLSDRGLLSIPLTTWPLSWPDVARSLRANDRASTVGADVESTLARIQQRLRQEMDWGYTKASLRMALSDNARSIRTFEDTPRRPAELGGAVEYTGERLAARVSLNVVTNPADDQNFRFDGSYLAYVVGNTSIAWSHQERWWGPGWNGSLILSSNARPVPGLAMGRVTSNAPTIPLLQWVGPWTWNLLATRLEGDRAVSHAYLLGLRVSLRPMRHLEIGLSRTAQWGGDGRPQNLDSLFDLAIGRDNAGDAGITADNEPGNQLAGFDARYSFATGSVSTALYGQLIGEDEAGGFPSRYLGMFGVSLSGYSDVLAGTFRVGAEWSDTTCQFHESGKAFDCAYNNSIYKDGYRYRGRAIGHATDSDSRSTVLTAKLARDDGTEWSAMLRKMEINRAGSTAVPHSISRTPSDILNLEFSHARELLGGRLSAGIGFDDIETTPGQGSDIDARLFVSWSITQ